jgi:hypothetical protein
VFQVRNRAAAPALLRMKGKEPPMLHNRTTLLAGLFVAGAALGAAGATALHHRMRQPQDDRSVGPLPDDVMSSLAAVNNSTRPAATQEKATANTSPDAPAPIDAKASSLTRPHADGAKLAAK